MADHDPAGEARFGRASLPLVFAKRIIPFGANFAIRTTDQRKVAYEAGLGVSPLHRRIGGEVEVIFARRRL